MIVRTANADDCEAIAALHVSSWRTTYRHILTADYLDHHVAEDRQDLWAARFAKFDHRKHHVAVVEADPAMREATQLPIAGFVCVLLDEEPDDGALLDNLHVAPQLHRHGVGRRLMASGAHWVAGMQPQWPMHLWVYQLNAKTVAFYRAWGGEEVDQRTIVTPAGNRAVVLRFEWRHPAALAHELDQSFGRRTA